MAISLNESELMAGLPSIVTECLLASARPKLYTSGTVMFFAGDPLNQVLLLTDGHVKKSQLSESGEEVVIRLAVPGEVVSELAFGSGTKHSSTAQALEDCDVLAWESETFSEALRTFPELLRSAQRILGRRLAELSGRLWEVSTKAASPRLANGLIHLLEHIGQEVDDHFEINVTQEVLGQMTAMTSTEVCRQLAILRREGIVKLQRGTIEIHSVPHLLSLCSIR